MRLLRTILTVRSLLAVILYVAIDLASYRVMIANGSGWAIAVFLVANGVVPAVIGLVLLIQRLRRDHTPTTLY
jgi:hypothetical protein